MTQALILSVIIASTLSADGPTGALKTYKTKIPNPSPYTPAR